jgi:hypothetical protein
MNFLLLAQEKSFFEHYSSELMILVLLILVLGTVLILMPQFLRSHLRKAEMQHAERMRALEQGQAIPPSDEPTKAAGRAAMVVPIVVVVTAGTVTCFLVAYRSDQLFSVSLAVWCVAGIVSLAAITGGVALLGRLAQLQAGEGDEEVPTRPLEKE